MEEIIKQKKVSRKTKKTRISDAMFNFEFLLKKIIRKRFVESESCICLGNLENQDVTLTSTYILKNRRIAFVMHS
uniref:Uncharacterized protein n=1 Tax=Onchocerca volvulus TaxID=6282 RepID=A0A8R1XXI0_ONCVO